MCLSGRYDIMAALTVHLSSLHMVKHNIPKHYKEVEQNNVITPAFILHADTFVIKTAWW